MTQKKAVKIFFFIFLTYITLAGISAQDIELYQSERIPAMVNDNNVNVRKGFGLSSEVLFMVNKGDYVYIIGQTTKTDKIGDWESVWYKIMRPSGDEFWIYGEFVTQLGEPSTYGTIGQAIRFFATINEKEFKISNGVYRCSMLYTKSSYEALFDNNKTANYLPYKMVVYNNTFALFLNEVLQPLSKKSGFFLPSFVSSENSWGQNTNTNYDYSFMWGAERSGGGEYVTLGLTDKSISVEVTHSYYNASSTFIRTFTKDFQGEPQILEWKPDYPVEYFIRGEDFLSIYSSPNLESAIQGVEIPCWTGEEDFSNWNDILPIENRDDFSKLNLDELPLFTVIDRMDGNDIHDKTRRWYKVIYNGITGFIIVSPRDLTSAKNYMYGLDLSYFGM